MASSAHADEDSMEGLCECCLRRTCCLFRLSQMVSDAQTSIMPKKSEREGHLTFASWIKQAQLFASATRRVSLATLSSPVSCCCVLFFYICLRMCFVSSIPPVVEAVLAVVLVVDGDPLARSIFRLEVFVWSLIVKVLFSSAAISTIAAAWLATLWYLFVFCWKEAKGPPAMSSEENGGSDTLTTSITTATGRAVRRVLVPALLVALLRRKIGLFGIFLVPRPPLHEQLAWSSFASWDTVAFEGFMSTLCAVFVASSVICLSDMCDVEETRKREGETQDEPQPSSLEEWMTMTSNVVQSGPSKAKSWRADVLVRLLLRCYVQTGLAHAHFASTSNDPTSSSAGAGEGDRKSKQQVDEADIVPLRAACVFMCLAVIVFENVLLFPVTSLYVLLACDFPLAMFVFNGSRQSAPASRSSAMTRQFGAIVLDWHQLPFFSRIAKNNTSAAGEGNLPLRLFDMVAGRLRDMSFTVVDKLAGTSSQMDEIIIDGSTEIAPRRAAAMLKVAARQLALKFLQLPVNRSELGLSPERRETASFLVSLCVVLFTGHIITFIVLPTDVVFFGSKCFVFFLIFAVGNNHALSTRAAVVLTLLFGWIHYMAAGLARFAFYPENWQEQQVSSTAAFTATIALHFMSLHCFVILALDVLVICCRSPSPFATTSSLSASAVEKVGSAHHRDDVAAFVRAAAAAAASSSPSGTTPPIKGVKRRRH